MAKPWKTDLFATAEDDIRQFGAALFGLFRPIWPAPTAFPQATISRLAAPGPFGASAVGG
jgi:hypothetical protein